MKRHGTSRFGSAAVATARVVGLWRCYAECRPQRQFAAGSMSQLELCGPSKEKLPGVPCRGKSSPCNTNVREPIAPAKWNYLRRTYRNLSNKVRNG